MATPGNGKDGSGDPETKNTEPQEMQPTGRTLEFEDTVEQEEEEPTSHPSLLPRRDSAVAVPFNNDAEGGKITTSRTPENLPHSACSDYNSAGCATARPSGGPPVLSTSELADALVTEETHSRLKLKNHLSRQRKRSYGPRHSETNLIPSWGEVNNAESRHIFGMLRRIPQDWESRVPRLHDRQLENGLWVTQEVDGEEKEDQERNNQV